MRLAPIVAAILLLIKALHGHGLTNDRGLLPPITPVAAASEQQGESAPGQMTATEQPVGPATVTKGMTKEQVQALWGQPVEVRQIRTCFGTREEWIYRGNPRRYGSEERTLLFDEGEVLEEIQ